MTALGGVFLKIGKGEKRVELRCLEGGTCVLKKIFEERGPRIVTPHVFPRKITDHLKISGPLV
jgi:hypothetical protein